MRLLTLLLLGLGACVLIGCENKNEQPVARQEEPYTPKYTSLDALDATPAFEPSAQPEPDATELSGTAEATGADEPIAVDSDEVLTPVGGEVYVVQKGDTLYRLARRFYNDQSRWREIWEANKTRLPDPNKLPVGMKLIIP